MNVVSTLPGLADVGASAAVGGRPDAETGQKFDKAIRDAAKDASARPKTGAASAGDRPAQGAASPAKADEPKTGAKSGGVRSVHERGKDGAHDGKDKTKDDAAADDLLGRLLTSEQPASAATKDGTALSQLLAASQDQTASSEPEGELKERLVITPMSMDGTAAVDDGDPATKARGKVTLDVLKMETHFEPNADDFVLVEGAADTTTTSTKGDAAPKSPDIKLSFDEALARLSAQQGQAGKEGDRSGNGTQQRTARQEAASTRADAEPSVGRKVANDAADDLALTRVATSDATGGGSSIASMTSQVAGRVIDAFGGAGQGTRASDRSSSETHIRMKAGGAALKTLTIQLQPENLGTLDVSMRLVDGQLTLELSASEASTARVLAEDRAGLKKLLEHAGFTMDDASISIVTRDPTLTSLRASSSPTADNGNTPGGQSQGGQAGQSGTDGRSAGGRREPGEHEARRQSGSEQATTVPETSARSRNMFL